MPSIVGTVISARTKRPINGAIVSLLVAEIQPSVEIKTTDEAGSLVLSGLQPGKYGVHAQADVIVPAQRHRIGFSGTSEEVEVHTDDSRVVVEIQTEQSLVDRRPGSQSVGTWSTSGQVPLNDELF